MSSKSFVTNVVVVVVDVDVVADTLFLHVYVNDKSK